MDKKRILEKDWEVIRPVLVDLDKIDFDKFYMKVSGRSMAPFRRTDGLMEIERINADSGPILQFFVDFMKKSRLACLFRGGYSYNNLNCKCCELKNRCWDSELVAYWKSRLRGDPKPNIQQLPKAPKTPTVTELSMSPAFSLTKEQLEAAEQRSKLLRNITNVKMVDINEKYLTEAIEEAVRTSAREGVQSTGELLREFNARLARNSLVEDTVHDQTVKHFQERIFSGLGVDPALFEQKWGTVEVTERHFRERYDKVTKHPRVKTMELSHGLSYDDLKEAINAPCGTKEPVITAKQKPPATKKMWCEFCDEVVDAIESSFADAHICPNDCLYDRCRSCTNVRSDTCSHCLAETAHQLNTDSGVEGYAFSDVIDPPDSSVIDSNANILNYYKTEVARIEREEELSRNRVDPHSLSDWLTEPLGSIEGIPKKFKTTL